MRNLIDIDIEKDYRIKYDIIDYYDDGSFDFEGKCNLIDDGKIIFYMDLVNKNNGLFLLIRKIISKKMDSCHLFKWLGTIYDYSTIRKNHTNGLDRFECFMSLVVNSKYYYSKKYGLK